MMRTALLAVLLLSMLPLLAQEKPDAEQLTREGVALYDAGKLDEAIVKYKAALAADPHYTTASYELGLTLAAKGDYAGCRAALQPIAFGKGPLQVQTLVMLGNCTDSAGDRKKATEIYRTALALAPDEPRVAYELGVVLLNDGKFAEAREMLKKDVTARPNHVNGRYALAMAFQSDNFRIPAALEYLHVLAFDPVSPVGKQAAQNVKALLDAGVERKDEKNIHVTVDPNERTEEGDYKTLAMGLALASAARFTEKNETKSEFEQVQEQVVSVIRMFLEMTPVTQKDYTAAAHRPFFEAMEKAGLLEPFVANALASLHLAGASDWSAKNQAELQKYFDWIRPQREGKPAVVMPSSGK
jgi:thioredoxin-like negative regulator of GroEL